MVFGSVHESFVACVVVPFHVCNLNASCSAGVWYGEDEFLTDILLVAYAFRYTIIYILTIIEPIRRCFVQSY